jgi:hypothetical protein
MYSLYQNEYRIFKLVEISIRRGLRKKKNRGDKPILVIIHICMKCHKETPCIDNLNKQKCHLFFFYKVSEQYGETGLAWGGLEPGGGRRSWRKGIVGCI